MKSHHFGEDGYVSIWVGEFPSKELREEHLRERSGEERGTGALAAWMGEFGFAWFDHDFMSTNWTGLSLRPLSKLVAQCSYSASYLDAALAAAQEQGISTTQCVLLLFNFCYDPKVTGVKEGSYLRFLGAFRYVDE